MVEDGAFSNKIDKVTILWEILNCKGQPNCITGSRVTAVLLNGWILPFGGASVVEGLLSTGPTPSSFHDYYKALFNIRMSPCKNKGKR